MFSIPAILDPADLFGTRQAAKEKDAKKALNENADVLQQGYDSNNVMAGQYKDFIDNMYGTSNADYQSALTNYMNNVGNYSYDKDVKDFYSPAAQLRVQQAMDAITNSNANAGNMFSSDYINSLAAKQQALASEEYDKAYDRMMADKNYGLQEYSTNTNALGNLASMLGNDRNTYANAYGDYMSQLINNENALTQGLTNINSNKAQIAANRRTSIL